MGANPDSGPEFTGCNRTMRTGTHTGTPYFTDGFNTRNDFTSNAPTVRVPQPALPALTCTFRHWDAAIWINNTDIIVTASPNSPGITQIADANTTMFRTTETETEQYIAYSYLNPLCNEHIKMQYVLSTTSLKV